MGGQCVASGALGKPAMGSACPGPAWARLHGQHRNGSWGALPPWERPLQDAPFLEQLWGLLCKVQCGMWGGARPRDPLRSRRLLKTRDRVRLCGPGCLSWPHAQAAHWCGVWGAVSRWPFSSEGAC